MNGVAVVVIVVGAVAVAGALCWFVVATAQRRGRIGRHGDRRS